MSDRDGLQTGRLIQGLLAAPVVVFMAMFALVFEDDGGFGPAIIVGAVGYTAALLAGVVLGLPLHFVLRSLGRRSVTNYWAIGAVAGAGATLIFLSLMSFGNVGTLRGVVTLLAGGGAGIGAASVFWWIAVRDRGAPGDPAPQTPAG